MKKISSLFTLIELLVVIAIIAILAAILLPSLKTAKDRGVRISCLNNERQMHLICTGYVNDMDGYYPVHWFKEPGYSPLYYHCSYMNHLIRSGHIAPVPTSGYPTDCRVCPALAGRQPQHAIGYNLTHYVFSWYLSGYYNGSVWVWQPHRINSIKRPSLTYELAESQYYTKDSAAANYKGRVSGGGFDMAPWSFSYVQFVGADMRLNSNSLYSNIDLIKPRHKDGINLFYADGHGKFLLYPYQDSTLPNNNLERKMTF